MLVHNLSNFLPCYMMYHGNAEVLLRQNVFKFCCVLYSRTGRVGHVVCVGERRGACRMLVDRPEGKGLLRRPEHRWEEKIKMDLQEVGWAGIDSIVLA